MEVRQVRTQEIKLIKVDEPEVNIRYIGRSSSMRGLTSEPIWQILREYRNGDIITSTYALMGEFSGVWDDRTSYFTAAIPDPDNPLDGNIAVTGSFTPSGLRVAGRVSTVTLSTTGWTALPPAGALSNRNAINIQNYSGDEIRLQFDNTVAGFVGVILNDQSERNYDIKDSIQIYAKAKIGGTVIVIEEIS
jgi:hypothetical protein